MAPKAEKKPAAKKPAEEPAAKKPKAEQRLPAGKAEKGSGEGKKDGAGRKKAKKNVETYKIYIFKVLKLLQGHVHHELLHQSMQLGLLL
ncbi:hypothetical protein ABZP36_015640 [Zizania latifolia]